MTNKPNFDSEIILLFLIFIGTMLPLGMTFTMAIELTTSGTETLIHKMRYLVEF